MSVNEIALYEPVKKYLEFQDYKICSEFQHTDVAGIKQGKLAIIELKTSINFEQLIKCALRQNQTDFIYIAIPKPRKMSQNMANIQYLIRRLEMGLLYVNTIDNSVTCIIEPLPYTRKTISNNKNFSNKLIEHFDSSHEASGHNKLKPNTYIRMSLFISCCCSEYGKLSLSDLNKIFNTTEKTFINILSDNFYGWFRIYPDNSFCLSEEGKKAINEYPDLTENYKKSLKAINLKY